MSFIKRILTVEEFSSIDLKFLGVHSERLPQREQCFCAVNDTCEAIVMQSYTVEPQKPEMECIGTCLFTKENKQLFVLIVYIHQRLQSTVIGMLKPTLRNMI